MAYAVLVERWTPGTPVRTTTHRAPDYLFARELMMEFRAMGHRAAVVTVPEEES